MASSDCTSSLNDIIQAQTVTSDPVQAGTSAPFHVQGVLLKNPTGTVFTATGTIPASAFVNGFWTLTTSAPATLTFPTAADVLTAFTAAGEPLSLGDSFTIGFTNTSTNTVTFAASGTVVAFSSLIAATSRKSGKFVFTVTGSAQITAFEILSNA